MTVNEKLENGQAAGIVRNDLKESMKQNLYLIIGNAIEDETRRATEEIMKERESAVQQLAEETRALFKKLLEEEKKSIWANEMQSTTSVVFNSGDGQGKIEQAYDIQSTINIINIDALKTEPLKPGNNHKPGVYEENVELEILPPRDQNAIAIINNYLINMLEIKKVDLVTLSDTSVFKVIVNKPVDFVARLSLLPQVFNAQEIFDKGRRQIKITLSAKLKPEPNQNEASDKGGKIFKKKN